MTIGLPQHQHGNCHLCDEESLRYNRKTVLQGFIYYTPAIQIFLLR